MNYANIGILLFFLVKKTEKLIWVVITYYYLVKKGEYTMIDPNKNH